MTKQVQVNSFTVYVYVLDTHSLYYESQPVG